MNKHTFPAAPATSSPLVKEAYRQGLARIRVGLTKRDLRQLHAGVKRGDLAYVQDLNLPGHWMRWQPVVQQEA